MSKETFYSRESVEVLEMFEVSPAGLSEDEAKERLKRYGYNLLPESHTKSIFAIFFDQFKSPLIYLLFVAAIVVYFAGEIADALIVLGVVFVNSIIGSIQEGRAQNALLALKKMTETEATVIRDGKESVIPDREVVPGDIVVLREGDKIGADARIIRSNQLLVNESVLTGESLPIEKTSDIISKEAGLPIADQKNMIFRGTYVLGGNCTAIVVTTGAETVIGAISQEITKIDTEIPLKGDIKVFSRKIIYVVGIVSVALFALGFQKGLDLRDTLATVVSLAVSIIPEGLPVVLTVVLATGVWRMSKRNALVRKLQAVEALGQTDVIAVDKTGTITNNQMIVEDVYTGLEHYAVHGTGYDPKGKIMLGHNVRNANNDLFLERIGKMCALFSKAHVAYIESEDRYKVTGDPTEAAMKVFAEKAGINISALEIEIIKQAELPFNSLTKYQAFTYALGGKYEMMVVGAPEVILNRSTSFLTAEGEKKISDKERERISEDINSLSGEGKRVVAFARKTVSDDVLLDSSVAELSLVGIIAMRDALRVGVAESITKARGAGIKVVMISGDHLLTATSIAREAKIYKDGDRVVSGNEIESMSEVELANAIENTTVFARVAPEHKMKIIQAYQSKGMIIAMTGDGVNDAPSLVAADLGIAMGKDGTEVAKEASDIVLLDDNFKSIVSAIEEGRGILKTIKKVIFYLFSTSVGEVLTITGAMVIGFPLPILPAQIIWLNFVTDGFLDVSLATEPIERGLLRERKRNKARNLVDMEMVWRMFIVGIPMAIGTLFLFNLYLDEGITKALTVSLTSLAVFQWFNAWNARHNRESVFSPKGKMNWYLVGATILVIVLQLMAVYNPTMQRLLHTTALHFADWLLIILVAISVLVVEEIRKSMARKASRK